MPAGWVERTLRQLDSADRRADDRQPGYYNGNGSDLVTYRMPATIAAQVKSVRATLNYQSIPPYYLRDRFNIGGNNPATATLRALVQYVDYSNTAVKGWKLPIASAAVAVR